MVGMTSNDKPQGSRKNTARPSTAHQATTLGPEGGHKKKSHAKELDNEGSAARNQRQKRTQKNKATLWPHACGPLCTKRSPMSELIAEPRPRGARGKRIVTPTPSPRKSSRTLQGRACSLFARMSSPNRRGRVSALICRRGLFGAETFAGEIVSAKRSLQQQFPGAPRGAGRRTFFSSALCW